MCAIAFCAFFVSGPMVLIIVCGLLGLGTAVVGPPAIGVVISTYPEGKRRNKAMGFLGCGNPIGFFLGSISSAAATETINWRFSFGVISVFYAILTLLTCWAMPTIKPEKVSSTQNQKFDKVGATLIAVGMIVVSIGLT